MSKMICEYTKYRTPNASYKKCEVSKKQKKLLESDRKSKFTKLFCKQKLNSGWIIDKKREKCYQNCGNKGGLCEEYCGPAGYCCSKHYWIMKHNKYKNGDCSKQMRKDLWKQTWSFKHKCISKHYN